MPPCLPLETNFFPKFMRTYGTSMHHDNYHSHNYIVPPLINFLLGYVTLIHYDFGSREFPVDVGTPALFWRVSHFAGYYEPPLYHWNEVYLEGLAPAACTGPACSDGSSV